MNELVKFRESRGLTQSQLGELLGTTKATVSRWETDKRQPDPAMALTIEKILGIPRHLVRPDIYDKTDRPGPKVAKRKSIAGCMKGFVKLPENFNPAEPFWSDWDDWVEREVDQLERQD
jgi:transcriptional regulator with XRE-family HTH domain